MYTILNTLLALLLATVFIRSISNWRRLRKAPGPFLAGVTDLWRAYYQYNGKLRQKIEELHAEDGGRPVVRYGVNSISIADPEVINVIYGSRKGFTTADSYKVLIGIQNGKEVPSLVSTSDEARHGALRRSVASAFTPQAVRGYESAMDATIAELLDDVIAPTAAAATTPDDHHGQATKTFDLSSTMLYLTMDTAGRFTFGESLGCLANQADVGGSIALIRSRFDHWGVWSSVPWLERLVYRNPLAMWWSSSSSSSSSSSFSLMMKKRAGRTTTPASSRMAALAVSKLQSRRRRGRLDTQKEQEQNNNSSSSSSSQEEEENDLLQRFIEASKDHPEALDDKGIIGMLMSTISGAGDTTATTIVAALYFLIRHPTCLGKLRDELLLAADQQEQDQDITTTTTKEKMTSSSSSSGGGRGGLGLGLDYATTLSRLPYLQAVVRESMRLFPTPTWPIERVVPSSPSPPPSSSSESPPGLEVSISVNNMTGKGKEEKIYVPPGTSVGCLPSVIHMDKKVFGEDAGDYRPERWLLPSSGDTGGDSDSDTEKEREKERIRMMEAAHMGFSRGKRNCLGQHVAVMQVKKVVAAVVMRFDLSLVDEDAKLEADFSPAVACLKPLHVRCETRKS